MGDSLDFFCVCLSLWSSIIVHRRASSATRLLRLSESSHPRIRLSLKSLFFWRRRETICRRHGRRRRPAFIIFEGEECIETPKSRIDDDDDDDDVKKKTPLRVDEDDEKKKKKKKKKKRKAKTTTTTTTTLVKFLGFCTTWTCRTKFSNVSHRAIW